MGISFEKLARHKRVGEMPQAGMRDRRIGLSDVTLVLNSAAVGAKLAEVAKRDARVKRSAIIRTLAADPVTIAEIVAFEAAEGISGFKGTMFYADAERVLREEGHQPQGSTMVTVSAPEMV